MVAATAASGSCVPRVTGAKDVEVAVGPATAYVVDPQVQSVLNQHYIGRFRVDRDKVLESLSSSGSLPGVYRHRDTALHAKHTMSEHMRTHGVDRSRSPLIIISPEYSLNNVPADLLEQGRATQPVEWTARTFLVDGLLRLLADQHLQGELQGGDEKVFWDCHVWTSDLLTFEGFEAYAVLHHRSSGVDLKVNYTDADRYQLYIRTHFQDPATTDAVQSIPATVDLRIDRLHPLFAQGSPNTLPQLRSTTRYYPMRDALYQLSKVGVFAEQFNLDKASRTLSNCQSASLMVEVVRAGAVFWGSIGDFSVQTNTLYWNQFFLEISRAHLSNPFIPTASTSSEDLSTRIGEFIDAIKHLPYPPLWRYTARDRGGFDTARDMLLERISPSTEHVKSDGRIHEVYEWQARWPSTICGQEALPAGSQSPTWFPYVVTPPDLFGHSDSSTQFATVATSVVLDLVNYLYHGIPRNNTVRQSMHHALSYHCDASCDLISDEQMKEINQYLLEHSSILELEAAVIERARECLFKQMSNSAPEVVEMRKKGKTCYLSLHHFPDLNPAISHSSYVGFHGLFAAIKQPSLLHYPPTPLLQVQSGPDGQCWVKTISHPEPEPATAFRYQKEAG